LIENDGWVISGDALTAGCAALTIPFNIVEVSFPQINSNHASKRNMIGIFCISFDLFFVFIYLQSFSYS